MAPQHIIDAEERVGLRLTVPDRQLVLACQYVKDNRFLDRIRQTPDGELVPYTLDELEDLHGSLAFDANNTDVPKRRRGLNRILRRIEELLDTYSDDPDDESDDLLAEMPMVTSPGDVMRDLFPSGDQVGPPLPAVQYQVAFTRVQRDTLLAMDTVPGDIHRMLNRESKSDQQIDLSPRQMIVLSLAVQEALHQSPRAKLRRSLQNVAERISVGMYEALQEASEHESDERYRASQTSQVNDAFQLKIMLEGTKPPIWRRVVIGDCELDILHEIVQMAMGWENCHMHMFEWGKHRFSHPRLELEGEHYDETRVRLSQLAADGCKKLRYWYDFGDDWWHTIQIEKKLQPKPGERFPRCIDGSGACPPEDCGGVWGYYDLLEALRDPHHERHEELQEWIGDDFDPNEFELEEVNQALAW